MYYRRQVVLIDHHVDDRRLAAGESALDGAFEILRAGDVFAMGAEHFGQRAEIRIFVIHGEITAAKVFVLERAFIAQALVVERPY